MYTTTILARKRTYVNLVPNVAGAIAHTDWNNIDFTIRNAETLSILKKGLLVYVSLSYFIVIYSCPMLLYTFLICKVLLHRTPPKTIIYGDVGFPVKRLF